MIDTAGPEPAARVEQVRLVVGVIVGAFGVHGEAKLRLTTDDPEHLKTIRRIWIGDEPRPRKLLAMRFHAGQALVRISGVTTPEQVDALRGEPVRIAGADARPPEPGEYFLYQLIGLRAENEAGVPLGVLTDVMETGAHDVFVITPEGGGPDLLLPNHPQYVLDVQPEAGRIVVRPIEYD
ncbi:MAG: 16S rRNA processing protein RimM [Thermomicrobiales bacterium]|nr:16S rRNA processing protein RimM [Thermomicrobiales bacterium]